MTTSQPIDSWVSQTSNYLSNKCVISPDPKLQDMLSSGRYGQNSVFCGVNFSQDQERKGQKRVRLVRAHQSCLTAQRPTSWRQLADAGRRHFRSTPNHFYYNDVRDVVSYLKLVPLCTRVVRLKGIFAPNNSHKPRFPGIVQNTA